MDDVDQPAPPEKPAILKETEFIVEEGILHRTFRTGAIWMNKLFFSSAFLWALWLVIGYIDGAQACSEGLGQVGSNSSEDLGIVADGTCSVLLTATSRYLGAMTVLSFILSIGLGLMGLVIGKRVLERTAAADEVGAEKPEE